MPKWESPSNILGIYSKYIQALLFTYRCDEPRRGILDERELDWDGSCGEDSRTTLLALEYKVVSSSSSVVSISVCLRLFLDPEF
jgi:hypothetical protein